MVKSWHLFERDCSLTGHQKVVEVAPCVSMMKNNEQPFVSCCSQLWTHVGLVNGEGLVFRRRG